MRKFILIISFVTGFSAFGKSISTSRPITPNTGGGFGGLGTLETYWKQGACSQGTYARIAYPLNKFFKDANKKKDQSLVLATYQKLSDARKNALAAVKGDVDTKYETAAIRKSQINICKNVYIKYGRLMNMLIDKKK